jgi:hypothetical protein
MDVESIVRVIKMEGMEFVLEIKYKKMQEQSDPCIQLLITFQFRFPDDLINDFGKHKAHCDRTGNHCSFCN